MRAAIRAAADPSQAAKREAAKARRTEAKRDMMERRDQELTKGTLERADAEERLNPFTTSFRARTTFHPARKRAVPADLADVMSDVARIVRNT